MRRGHLFVIVVMVAGGACTDSAKTAPQQEVLAKTVAETPPSVPVDPSLLPVAALLELNSLPLHTETPCSKTIETLRPVLDQLAQHRANLEKLTTQQQAIKELGSLAATLRSSVETIEPRKESPELRRISAELVASITDLAESTELLAKALGAQDKQAAANTMRRIKNGIGNIQISVKGLVAQCAS